MRAGTGISNLPDVAARLVRYNLKIIFATKFVYFLGVAVLLFAFTTLTRLLSDDAPTLASVYSLLLFPAILLVSYPTLFGVQNDADARMLEMIFAIPNYRYKIWLVRILLIYAVLFVSMLGFGLITALVLLKFSVLSMVIQVLFPAFFIGGLAFMFSTWVRNGNGTAVIMIAIGIAFWVARGVLEYSQWNLFLNPFAAPQDINEAIWEHTIFANRMILSVSTVLVLLYGLLNLQQREKFL